MVWRKAARTICLTYSLVLHWSHTGLTSHEGEKITKFKCFKICVFSWACVSAWGFSSKCHIQAPSLFLPPALISINHFSHFWLCKSCQLPIISDYTHLGRGRGDVVSKVVFWFTGFLQSVRCSLCAEQDISVEVNSTKCIIWNGLSYYQIIDSGFQIS